MKLRPWIFGWDSGATAIDMAFSMLLLVVFIIGIFEFAFGYWVLNSMQLAVEEGGRWAIAHHICPVGGGSTYPNCDPSGTKLPAGTCLDPTNSSQVTPTVKDVITAALPAGGLFPSSSVSATCAGGTPSCPCHATTSAAPAKLNISVSYVNGFLDMFGYRLGSADVVPLQ